MYLCKECGARASVVDNAIVRTCSHDGIVVAELSATLRGRGATSVNSHGIMRSLFVSVFDRLGKIW